MKCEIIETKIYIENEEVTVYGLEFISNNNILKRIENIFCEYDKIIELRKIINDNHVDIRQIGYIIEDYLID